MRICADLEFANGLQGSSMKFSASHSNTTLSIIIQDGVKTIFHIELPGEQDNIGGWYIRFTYLRKTQPQELNELLGAIPQLLEIQVDEDTHPTYLNVLYALFKWTENEKHEVQEHGLTENEIPNLYGLHQQLKHALFIFEVITSPNNGYYEAIFPHPGQEKLRVRIPSDNFDKSPVQTSQVMLKKALRSDPTYIEYFIHNYSHIQEYVMSADPTTFDVFSGLSKALVKLIRQENANLGIYISLVPDICTYIVKKELDSEEQKEYLEPILSSFETVEQKLERLNGIITDVKNEISLTRPDQANVRQFKEDDYGRLMHVISLISGHYLRIYDLDSSANFWLKAKSRDPLLWFFLVLHRRPYLFLFFQIVLLIFPSIYAYQHWLTGQMCPLILGSPGPVIGKCLPSLDSSSPEFIAMLTWYMLLLLLLLFIFTQIMRRRWLYSQLLLPRLLGAAIVGLLPLLLNDQSWYIGIQSSAFNWGFLALLTYFGSFIYVFIEVHNIKKFIKGHSIVQVLKEARRIFFIALSETLFIVTVTSSLIFPAVISKGGIDITSYRFGIYASTSVLSFGFFPSLIILWTGIALFIGSFVQLLWQDQRITESI
jgi:hypothetical protein